MQLNLRFPKAGLIYRYSSQDITEISEMQPDLLVNYGTGIYKGEILNCAKNGILSLHLGDNRHIRGQPAGFWEVLRRDDYTGYVYQILNETLDGGTTVLRGRVSTEFVIAKTLIKLG